MCCVEQLSLFSNYHIFTELQLEVIGVCNPRASKRLGLWKAFIKSAPGLMITEGN